MDITQITEAPRDTRGHVLPGGGCARAGRMRLRAFEQRRYPRAKLVQDVSYGILDSEMAITEATWDATVQGMRAHLAEQLRGVDRLLDAPA